MAPEEVKEEALEEKQPDSVPDAVKVVLVPPESGLPVTAASEDKTGEQRLAKQCRCSTAPVSSSGSHNNIRHIAGL